MFRIKTNLIERQEIVCNNTSGAFFVSVEGFGIEQKINNLYLQSVVFDIGIPGVAGPQIYTSLGELFECWCKQVLGKSPLDKE